MSSSPFVNEPPGVLELAKSHIDAYPEIKRWPYLIWSIIPKLSDGPIQFGLPLSFVLVYFINPFHFVCIALCSLVNFYFVSFISLYFNC